MRAHISIEQASENNIVNPRTPYLDTDHGNDAKQVSSSGKMCDGIQVTISITRTMLQHIVTLYFPLAWKGRLFDARKAHSRPKTS